MSEAHIINQPEAMSWRQRCADWSVTILMWSLWVYLILPFINAVFWMFGLSYIYRQIIEESGYIEMLRMLENAGWVIVLAFITLRLWGLYNYWAFGRRNRRKDSKDATTDDFSSHYELPSDLLERLRNEKEVEWPTALITLSKK